MNFIINSLKIPPKSDQQKWWSKKLFENRQSKSINIEITSYGVLSLIKANRLPEALPYFKWLLNQRNDQGGFVGTQDTVIGLEALAKYAEHLSSKDSNIQVRITSDSSNCLTLFTVNNENALLLQVDGVPSNAKSIRVIAKGKGFSLVQLSYRYNLNESDVYSTFTLNPKLAETTAAHLTVDVCSR